MSGNPTSPASPVSVPTVAGQGEPAPGIPDAAANPALTKGKRLTRTELKEIEKQFIGRLWVDSKRDWSFMYFRSDGTGTRVMDSRIGKKDTFKWSLRDDGVVTVGERSFTFPSPDLCRWHVPLGNVVAVNDYILVPDGKDPDK